MKAQKKKKDSITQRQQVEEYELEQAPLRHSVTKQANSQNLYDTCPPQLHNRKLILKRK